MAYTHNMKTNRSDVELNDYGFSAVDQQEVLPDEKAEIERLKFDIQSVIEKKKFWQDRAMKMYDTVSPFLDNLKKNPEKDYISWPDRSKKIDEFKELLAKIASGQISKDIV